MSSTFATGVGKRFCLKPEVALNTAPGAGSAQEYRHITFDSDLTIAAQMSDEKASDYQLSGTRLGMRKLTAALKGRLSGTTFGLLLAAALRKGWTAGPTRTAITFAASSSGPHLTDSANGFITDGWKVGMIASPAGFAGAGVANNAKRFKVTAVAAGGLTLANIDGTAAVIAAEVAGASVTISAPGKILWVPSTAHTFDSFWGEEYLSDLAAPIAWTSQGLRVSTIDLAMGVDQNIGIDVGFVGIDRQKVGSPPYFTSPTVPTVTGIMNTVAGSFRMNGVEVAYLTDLKQKIDLGIEPAGVLFSRVAPDHFPGRVMCGGSASAYLKDASYFDAFEAETEMALHYYLTSNPAPLTLGDVIAVIQPQIKLTAVNKADAEKAIIQSLTWNSHKYAAGSDSEQTTMLIQDTSMP